MSRAAVLIGVDHAGNLPPLQDAARGARRMEVWARAQGLGPVEVFTDEAGPVEIGEIKQAIRTIVDAGTTEQLLVYFAGHGVNIRYGEYWLLSGAPRDTQAAVNVAGSVVLAQYCGIPHVVFVSDACRTAAEGIQAQFVTGSEIFPNDGAGDLQKPVDQFFACLLGRPAHEIPDVNATAKEYSALYTNALLDGLDGKQPVVLDWALQASGRVGYVRPRPLKAYLQTEVAKRLKDSRLQTAVIQIPDAHIASDDTVWISRCHDEVLTVPPDEPPGLEITRPPDEADASASVWGAAASLLKPALSADLDVLDRALQRGNFEAASPASSVARSVLRTRKPFGPSHHETACGFKVRGATFAEAFSPHVQTELFGARDVVRVEPPQRPGSSVLLVFEDGAGVVLPAIPEFLTALTVEEGELVDVAYEPSDNTWRWGEFSDRAEEIRSLRAVAAAAAHDGVFRLEGADAEAIARRMQLAKGVDPALAIYAAYAYQDIQLTDRIREMSMYMRDDLGGAFFDVALLARALDGEEVASLPYLLSFVPLLSQGWGLLNAHQVQLPAQLEGIEQALKSSLWTMFNRAGVEQLRATLQAGAR
jgi:hypothetical protein